jgi:hypothetical protein
MKNLIFTFDPTKGELTLTIGNEQLIVPKFLKGTNEDDNPSYIATVDEDGQKQIIKKLVNNL